MLGTAGKPSLPYRAPLSAFLFEFLGKKGDNLSPTGTECAHADGRPLPTFFDYAQQGKAA
jgi:hypothetical protein